MKNWFVKHFDHIVGFLLGFVTCVLLYIVTN
jgi:hypothetical protein